DAQERHEAAEEHGLAAVLPEEALGRRQHLLEVPARDRPAEEQPAAAPAAEPVADVVADDRGGSRDRDHPEQRVVPLLREYRRGDQRRLARNRDARRLDRDRKEQQHQPVLDQLVGHTTRVAGRFDSVARACASAFPASGSRASGAWLSSPRPLGASATGSRWSSRRVPARRLRSTTTPTATRAPPS